MKRSEAEAEVRTHDRRCRGPLHPTAAAKRDAHIAAGEMTAAANADHAGRTPCGYDFNNIVCSVPFDGVRHVRESEDVDHRATCPQCGTRIAFVAPLYALDDEVDSPTG